MPLIRSYSWPQGINTASWAQCAPSVQQQNTDDEWLIALSKLQPIASDDLQNGLEKFLNHYQGQLLSDALSEKQKTNLITLLESPESIKIIIKKIKDKARYSLERLETIQNDFNTIKNVVSFRIGLNKEILKRKMEATFYEDIQNIFTSPPNLNTLSNEEDTSLRCILDQIATFLTNHLYPTHNHQLPRHIFKPLPDSSLNYLLNLTRELNRQDNPFNYFINRNRLNKLNGYLNWYLNLRKSEIILEQQAEQALEDYQNIEYDKAQRLDRLEKLKLTLVDFWEVSAAKYFYNSGLHYIDYMIANDPETQALQDSFFARGIWKLERKDGIYDRLQSCFKQIDSTTQPLEWPQYNILSQFIAAEIERVSDPLNSPVAADTQLFPTIKPASDISADARPLSGKPITKLQALKQILNTLYTAPLNIFINIIKTIFHYLQLFYKSIAKISFAAIIKNDNTKENQPFPNKTITFIETLFNTRLESEIQLEPSQFHENMGIPHQFYMDAQRDKFDFISINGKKFNCNNDSNPYQLYTLPFLLHPFCKSKEEFSFILEFFSQAYCFTHAAFTHGIEKENIEKIFIFAKNKDAIPVQENRHQRKISYYLDRLSEHTIKFIVSFRLEKINTLQDINEGRNFPCNPNNYTHSQVAFEINTEKGQRNIRVQKEESFYSYSLNPI